MMKGVSRLTKFLVILSMLFLISSWIKCLALLNLPSKSGRIYLVNGISSSERGSKYKVWTIRSAFLATLDLRFSRAALSYTRIVPVR